MEEKAIFLASVGLSDITLQPFRDIMGDTPLVTAGGYNDKNSLGVVESGQCDAIAYGRWFLSTPDFVER
jgi:2,4-dienoyl-CoA reductase-like NADH-dependent reductase (Old Yellow Enzyme family)